MKKLYDYELRTSSDIVKTDLELVHVVCGDILCDAEAEDNLEILVDMAERHATQCQLGIKERENNG